MTTMTTYRIQFSGWVYDELENALYDLETTLERTDELMGDEPQRVLLKKAVDSARVVVNRNRGVNTYEVVLSSLEEVDYFAREMAWFVYHHEGIREDDRRYGEPSDAETTPIINASKKAFARANEILEGAGRPTVQSY